MSRYYKAKDVETALIFSGLCDGKTCAEVKEVLNSIPTIDRPQGEWIDKGDYAECSNCGADSGTQYDGVEPIPLKTNFCPNCGARMKGADDE